MYTESLIYELVIKDEDREVWKVYLARQNWDLAKRYAKVSDFRIERSGLYQSRVLTYDGGLDRLLGRNQNQRQRDSVLATEADAFFAAGRYIQSAQSYAQSSKPFEEVVLRFVDKNERDALRYYLVARLERLKRTVRSSPIFFPIVTAESLTLSLASHE